MRRGLALAAALAAVVGAGLTVRDAHAKAAAARPWYEEITVNGFLSTAWSYNFDRPESRLNTYRVFDFDDNSLKVDVVELVLQHPAEQPRQPGFRVDLAAGGSIPHASAATGLFRDPGTGLAQDFDLQQAFASYVAPVGSGLHLDIGKFITAHGAEVIEGYDGWNDNATRSLLFGYAIPFTHTGVRANYAFSPRVSGTGMLVNGWDNATDNNRAKSLGAQLALTPRPAFTLIASGMLGRERADGDGGSRRLIDLVAILKPGPRVTVVANVDVAREHWWLGPPTSRMKESAEWSGVAAYLRWQARERFALIARLERFNDHDGVRTGTAQTLNEATLTPELRVTPRFVLRADLRRDDSNALPFMNRGRSTDHQTTVLVNALGWF